jgi:alkanesulfonate monooxygenase SsuD/methylene tetrahydromethanopterin reductase-like flavin-dependent oxidoreductase (luciferase family)
MTWWQRVGALFQWGVGDEPDGDAATFSASRAGFVLARSRCQPVVGAVNLLSAPWVKMVSSSVSFGVHLPTRMLPGGEVRPPSHKDLNDIVDSAKQAGFAAVWVTDHIVYVDPWMDCLLMLSAIAGKAKEHGLAIATGILGLPLRHPVALAQTLATLDILSGGNLIIGVGEGSTRSDFDALGIPFEERRRTLEDGVVALRSLLSYSNVDHHGPYYRFKNVTVSPRSIQDPCPPIWLASWGSPAGMRRVARFGDGWVASAWHSTPEEFRVSLGLLNSALDRRGRAPESFPNAVDTMFMYIAEDGKGARDVAAPIIERATGTAFDGDSGHYLVGSYQECKALVQRWVEAGANQICVWPVMDAVDQIKRFGEHILSK